MNFISRFLADKKGNFAAIFAVSLFPIFLSIGVAFDYSNMTGMHKKAQFATDAAILAAAIAVRDEGLIDGDTNSIIEKQSKIENLLQAEFKNYFEANVKANGNFKLNGIDTKYSPKDRESTAQVSFTYKPFIMGKLVSDGKLKVAVSSSIVVDVEKGGAVSVFLVLDKSGSMRGRGKMSTLKKGVEELTKQFESSDPEHKYVRMGAIAYDHYPSRVQSIEWGTAQSSRFVRYLAARGGTDSYRAVMIARSNLRNSKEEKAHKEMNGQDPKKYLVFMTDGSNNSRYSDTRTKRVCDDAKRDNIEVFTVAFKAPSRGQQLLSYCATSNSHFFNADNNAKLLEAFQKIGASVSSAVTISK